MNFNGQAALEYLMTYGWALIIIATVVGVLTFLVSSPTSKVTCTSSDPSDILMKSSNIPALPAAGTPAATAVIAVQNATGGQISSISTGVGSVSTGTFAAVARWSTSSTLPGADQNLASVVSGGSVYIFPKYSSDLAVGSSVLGSFDMNYRDPFGYVRKATITCQGKV